MGKFEREEAVRRRLNTDQAKSPSHLGSAREARESLIHLLCEWMPHIVDTVLLYDIAFSYAYAFAFLYAGSTPDKHCINILY